MEKLPTEMYVQIYTYLDIKDLKPFDKLSEKIIKSNIIWEEHVKKKFNINDSINFYKEYAWQLKLKKHQFSYKRQWTLGCVGRIKPLLKPKWNKPDIF